MFREGEGGAYRPPECITMVVLVPVLSPSKVVPSSSSSFSLGVPSFSAEVPPFSKTVPPFHVVVPSSMAVPSSMVVPGSSKAVPPFSNQRR